MATSLTSNVKASLGWTFNNVLTTIGNVGQTSSFSYTTSTTNGTSSGKADLLYVTTGTINSSSSLSLDLYGSLTDFFGSTISFAKVRSFMIVLTTDTAATSVLVGNGTNPLVNWVGSGSHTVRIRNGGCLLLASGDSTGYAVTNNSADVLKILNEDASNTATYQIAIIGTSA